jgi:hypothetical protein
LYYFRRINLRLYDEQMYLFILLALPGLLVKARIRGGASLVGDPGTGRENLDSLRLVCPESE